MNTPRCETLVLPKKVFKCVHGRSNFSLVVLDGLLVAVGGFTGSRTTASMEVLDRGVWLHCPDTAWLPLPRSALACAVLPISGMEQHLQKEDVSGLRELEERMFRLSRLDVEDQEDSDTSEEEEEMGEDEDEDSPIEDSEEDEEVEE